PLPSATPEPAPTYPLTYTAVLTTAVEAPVTPLPPSPTPLPPADPPSDATGWASEIARLVNQARAQHGLPPLAYNPTLVGVAQAHAEDCLQRGWGSHTGSDGSNVRTRMIRAGYNPLRWSECWAHTRSPQDAMRIWMNETPPNDPHRRTILSPDLTEIGVGVVQPAWGYYFFANFGTPR
ncbi:MAG TPA: CAP domain-containing protein, partial [Chloroflexi bacterium]|nr:CAP domain-containing protein [Chloroflexota bacterium]